MFATMIGRIGVVALGLALFAGACGDGNSDEDRQCRPCTSDAGCDSDHECVLAVDGENRCFKDDKDTCKLDRVDIKRAPTPSPTGPTPAPTATP